MKQYPLLVVTPHCSGCVPQHILREMLGADSLDLNKREATLRHLFDQGDPYTDLIFDVPGAHSLQATVSRFVVDLNRERHVGGRNGVIKLTDFDAAALYPPGFELSDYDVEERLRRYWDPYHEEIAHTLKEQGVELLLDGHSMTPFGPAIGPDARSPRPALTLMTGGDEQGEPVDGSEPTIWPQSARELRAAAERAFAPVLADAEEEVSTEVALNRPWSVDEISNRHARASGVPAFGLEINRALYLETVEGRERPRSGRIEALQGCVVSFAAEAIEIVRRHAIAGGSSMEAVDER